MNMSFSYLILFSFAFVVTLRGALAPFRGWAVRFVLRHMKSIGPALGSSRKETVVIS